MQPELLIVAAICAALGLGIGFLLGRFMSRPLLVLLWLGLAGTFLVYGVLSVLPSTDWMAARSFRIMAFMISMPAFLLSLLGGWLGLRQKGRNAS